MAGSRRGPLETPAAARIRGSGPTSWPSGTRRLRGTLAGDVRRHGPEMLAQEDRLDALRPLDVPTLVLVGEQDAPFLAAVERMAEAIPGARLEVIARRRPQPPAWRTPAGWAEVVVAAFLDGSLPVASPVTRHDDRGARRRAGPRPAAAAAGVTELFTLSGGHIFPLLDAAVKTGVRIVDVRHEQTAVFAAEGTAKLTRRPASPPSPPGPGSPTG